ncbi:putative Pentapeptide repeat family protein [Hyella patelloides LEGE 07179]|uniref:Putative Pentapeptide repeat family protein n=1 Tax=Hyella patelloides LEGE 07179 TaxID=945734 RepID=A0A563VP49_9CYAN|nr:pentapeptide repeat-containing protein [Hyella patelloides]VEP13184.1 putative Pentapeptide repeat family protein [Hyella patelloides LEGE 07179]
MMNEERNPSEYDLVLGGDNPPPVDGLVLGGIEGVKRKFSSSNTDKETIRIFKEALKYDDIGKDWLYEILETATGEIQWIAAVVLSEIANKPYKRLFYQWEKRSSLPQIISITKKDTKKVIKKKDNLKIILELVPSDREKQLVEYFKNTILENRGQWHIWRKKYSQYMLYLRGIDLCECDLRKINLSNINLVNANFKRANLPAVNLTGSILCYANLSQTNLYIAILKQVDFRKANLKKARLYGEKIIQCHFGEANLYNVDCENYCFKKSIFTNANLSYSSLIYSDFRDVIIDKANFFAANFRRANISGLDFKGLNIRYANFARSIRKKTNFKGAYFKGAHFSDDYYEPGWE